MSTLFRMSLFTCLATLCLVAMGDDEPKAAKPGKIPAKAKKQATEADREEAVFLLVREHYPDLVELLKRLKGTKQKEYQQAVKELYRDSQRLEAARRDPERYDLELRAWQLDSRIRLLAAKLSIEDRPEQQEDLKAALAQRADVRLAQKKLERERLTARIEKLDQEIDGFASARDEDLQRTFDRLVRTAKKARPVKKPVKDKKPVADAGAASPSTQPTKPEADEVSPKE